MGILIRLNLVGNKDELNVKVLNDENLNLPDTVNSPPNILVDFNVSFSRKGCEKNIDIFGPKNSEQISSNVTNKENSNMTINEEFLKQISTNGRDHESDDGDNCNDSGESLEEYFVIDKIVGSRFNPQTKKHEFLLKLKDCSSTKNTWKSVTGPKSSDLPQPESRLYVQKTRNLLPLKRKNNEVSLESNEIARQNNSSPLLVDLDEESDTPPSSEITASSTRQSSIIAGEMYRNVRNDANTGGEASATGNDYNSFFVDTDSVQSVGDISIKCEPLIESVQGNSDYDFDNESDPVSYGKPSSYYNGTHDNPLSVDDTYDEDVKPSLHDLNSSNPFVCSQCGRSFSAIHYLRRHETIHSKAKVYTCSICTYAFGNAYLLSLHERNAHEIRHRRRRRGFSSVQKRRQISRLNDDRPFKCPLCIRSFADRHALSLHEQVHNGGRLFPCSSCDRVFTYLHALKNHERIHSSVKSLPCSYCGKLFSMLARLKLHERKHRNEVAQGSLRNQRVVEIAAANSSSDDRVFTCSVCPKAFRLKHTLQIHMRQHTGEKPYACGICDYRSAQKVSLSCHMRKHEREWFHDTANMY